MKQIPTYPPYLVSTVDPDTGVERELRINLHTDIKEAAREAQGLDTWYRHEKQDLVVLVRDSNPALLESNGKGRRVYACRGYLIDNRMPRGSDLQIIAAGIFG